MKRTCAISTAVLFLLISNTVRAYPPQDQQQDQQGKKQDKPDKQSKDEKQQQDQSRQHHARPNRAAVLRQRNTDRDQHREAEHAAQNIGHRPAPFPGREWPSREWPSREWPSHGRRSRERRRVPFALLRAIQAVTGVPQSGQNVPVIIELTIDRRRPYSNVRMMAVKLCKAHLSREQADKPQLARAVLLESIDRRDRGIAGGEHRIERNNQALGKRRGAVRRR